MPVAIKEATRSGSHFIPVGLRVSVGGRTGNLQSVDEDVPASILNREKIPQSVKKQTVDNHTYLRTMSWDAAGVNDESLKKWFDL